MDAVDDANSGATVQMALGVAEPSVSVVIAAYNAASFIGRAIGSVQAQTLHDFEIIVVDDFSTDDTASVVRQLSAVDARISLLTSEVNAGPSVARNRGIAAARGKWIAVLDADDAYRPERLARLVSLAERHDLDMIADDIEYHDSSVGKTVGRSFANASEALLPVNLDSFLRASLFRPALLDFSARPTVQHALLKFVFRRSFLQGANLGYPEHIRDSEDFFFYAECLLAAGRCAIAPSADYVYTQRVGSVSKAPSGKTRTVIDRRQVVSGVDELLRRHHPELTRRQVGQLKRRRSQAIGLRAFEAVLSQLRERQPALALATLTLTPPAWAFLAHALLRRTRRSPAHGPG